MQKSVTTNLNVDQVKNICARHLDRVQTLPCRVDEMTPREFQIFEIVAYHNGFLQFLRDAL